MIYLIATHPLISLLAVVLIAIIVALFVVLKEAGLHDAPPLIEPGELSDEQPCAWCQREQAIKAQPHESHGICKRHAAEMLEESKRFSKSVHA